MNNTLRQKINFYRYGNIMIDLETLSTRTNATITKIAAVEFNKWTGETGDELLLYIDENEWGKHNRHIDGETIVWWLSQSEDAVKSLLSTDVKLTLNAALQELSTFIRGHDNIMDEIPQFDLDENHILLPEDDKKRRVVVWGNGATMDISILQSAYEHFDYIVPWQYWAVNDVRTIVDLKPSVKKDTQFEGVKHNPIDDCKHQIKYLCNTLKELKINNEQNI